MTQEKSVTAVVSVIIPTHNGAHVIRDTVNQFMLDADLPPLEIIVVENGSQDQTNSILREIQENWDSKHQLKVMHSVLGIGAAYSKGVSESSGSIVYLTADDIPFGIDDLKGGLALITQSDFIIGSKGHPESIVTRSWKRNAMTSAFRLARKLILDSSVRDSQGTFIIHGEWIRKTSPSIKEDGFLWSTILVDRAESANLNIVEIPVTLQTSGEMGTRVKVKDIFGMGTGLLKVRRQRKLL